MTALCHSFRVFVLVWLKANSALEAELLCVGFSSLLLFLNISPPFFEFLGHLVDVFLTHGVESALEFLHVIEQGGIFGPHELLIANHNVVGMRRVLGSSSEEVGVGGGLLETLDISARSRELDWEHTTSMTRTME
jgi:hypothetical protein